MTTTQDSAPSQLPHFSLVIDGQPAEPASGRRYESVDPFSGAAVISRGIVGDRGGRATVQSPILKQAFALEDGCCLDDPRVSVPVYPVRVTDEGEIQIARLAA